MRKQLKAGLLTGSKDTDGPKDICSGALFGKRLLFLVVFVPKAYFRAVLYAVHGVGHG
jgi:hypothetical protein